MIENNIGLYEIFYYVAKVGNITKTAEMLFLTQPAVTQSIHKLEDMLGGTLFIRNKRGVVLTYEGKVLFDYISPFIEGLKNAKNKFSQFVNLESGVINIGCGTTLTNTVLLPVIKKFEELHPNIHINIIHDFNSKLMDKLTYGQIDIMIFNMPYTYPKGIYVKSFKVVQDCFACSKEYYNKIDKIKNLNDLNNYKIILQQEPSSKRNFINEFCLKHNVVLKPTYELSSMTLVENFVKNSLGIGFLTKNQVEKELNDKSLIELNLEEKIPNREIAYAIKGLEYQSNAVKEFLKVLEECS